MNEWQRQDEEIRQLTLLRQSGHNLPGNMAIVPVEGAVVEKEHSLVGGVVANGGEEGVKPDWQLSWKSSFPAEQGAGETSSEAASKDESKLKQDSSIAYSSSLGDGSEEELVHTLYDEDLELANSLSTGQVAPLSTPALTEGGHEGGAISDLGQKQEQEQPMDAQVSRRKVFRVGGQGAEDSDSDSSSLVAALEKTGMKREKLGSADTMDGDSQNEVESGSAMDAASEISSNMSTARAGAASGGVVEPISILKVGSKAALEGEEDEEATGIELNGGNTDVNEQSRHLDRTSSFAFHGKDRTDIRRTRMVHWEGEEGEGTARGENGDNESVTTTNTAGTHEGTASRVVTTSNSPNSTAHFPRVLTQTEIRAMNPVVLPGSHKAPMVPPTSKLIEDRKILAMPLDLPPSIDIDETYTQTKLPEDQRVQLLLPLNRQSRKAVKKHKFEKDRKAALEQLKVDIARKRQERHGGTLEFHLKGRGLNAYEEVLVTANNDFRPYRKLDFKEPNPFYKLNQHEVTCRLLLGCVDKPKLANMKVGVPCEGHLDTTVLAPSNTSNDHFALFFPIPIVQYYLHGYLNRENLLVLALKRRYLIWEYVTPHGPPSQASTSAASDDHSVALSTVASNSQATTSDDNSFMATWSDGKDDDEEDAYYTPPAGALAAPNLFKRALAILLSSESHMDPALLSAIINADANSAVSCWDERKNKIQDVEGRKAARKALRKADEAAEMMLACSDRVSRKVRDAARRRILIKREEEAEKRRAEVDPKRGSPSKKRTTAATGGVTAHEKAQQVDEHEQKRRCKLLFVPLCLFCMDCGVLEVYITAAKASHYAVDMVSTGLPLVAKLLYGISLSHDKMKLTR